MNLILHSQFKIIEACHSPVQEYALTSPRTKASSLYPTTKYEQENKAALKLK